MRDVKATLFVEATLRRRISVLRTALDELTTFVGRTPNQINETGTVQDKALYDAYCYASRALDTDDRLDLIEKAEPEVCAMAAGESSLTVLRTIFQRCNENGGEIDQECVAAIAAAIAAAEPKAA